MEYCSIDINTKYKTTGTLDDFTIDFPWTFSFTPESIKVLRVNVPTGYSSLSGTNVLYVVSDIIGGIDNGYIVLNNTPIQITKLNVIAIIDPLHNYIATSSDPFFVCGGTLFGKKYHLPQPNKSIRLSLLTSTGTYPGSLSDWNITILCKINHPILHL